MKTPALTRYGCVPAVIALGLLHVVGQIPAHAVEADDPLSKRALDARLRALCTEIQAALPVPDDGLLEAMGRAAAEHRRSEAEAAAAREALGKLQRAKGLVDHAKRKWIGGAEQGIAKAGEALRKAANDKEREAARQQLAHWQADKEAGIKSQHEGNKP